MDTGYTHEKNVEILISLMKKKGIKKVIASPGTTNVALVASLQKDPFFELISSVDERSGAYMACGLAEESGEMVAIACTGATASREYAPALTEAYYRRLPILAITCSQPSSRIGHNIPQVTDRTSPMPDMVKLSVQLNTVKDDEDEWNCVVLANKALLELKHKVPGPVHINLITTYDTDFSIKELPEVREIKRIEYTDSMPAINAKNVAIFVGSHVEWSSRLTTAVDRFCEQYNGVVLCDTTSNYKGKYRIFGNLVANQSLIHFECREPELVIHIGDVSGSYMSVLPKDVWRVNPDGEIRDTFRKLTYVFELEEADFFERCSQKNQASDKNITYYSEWKNNYDRLLSKINDIPFSGAWIAWKTMGKLPANSALHLGILNSLRCWNYFEMPKSVHGYCNVGGFGIDGCVSSLIGASLAQEDRVYIGVVGDLAFFYDMNSLGNRHVGNNVRILMVNNGKGFEFKHYGCFPTQAGLSDIVDDYIAAAGHFGNQSKELVKHYAQDLGFEYIAVSNKDEYLRAMQVLVNPAKRTRPLLIEAFTNTDDENKAQRSINSLEATAKSAASSAAKSAIKNMIGADKARALKNLMKKQ